MALIDTITRSVTLCFTKRNPPFRGRTATSSTLQFVQSLTESGVAAIAGDKFMRNPNCASESEDKAGDLRRSLPELIGSCEDASQSVFGTDGELNGREKHLVAVALAVAARCDGSVQKRLTSALAAGVQPREIVEVIGITIFMGGDVAAAYAPQALALLKSSSVQEQLDLACLWRVTNQDRKTP
jgi:AhpD family alkylhydroperoxidase